jgi:phosphate transport system protein
MASRARPKRHFIKELEVLIAQVLAMGRLAEERLRLAIRALIERNPDFAAIVIAGDEDIDRLHVEVDDRSFTLLALYQPAAVDLRTIMAVVKVSSDLERVGDLAVNIGEATQRYLAHPPMMTVEDIGRMADLSASMLHQALDAVAAGDAVKAEAVLEQDHALDRLKVEVFHGLIASMVHERRIIEPALNLILISRHLERVGDHATNIAEDVIFIVAPRDVWNRESATA